MIDDGVPLNTINDELNIIRDAETENFLKEIFYTYYELG